MYLPYAEFCDHNGLKRIYSSPEEHMANLEKMMTALLDEKLRVRAEIDSRDFRRCSGTEWFQNEIDGMKAELGRLAGALIEIADLGDVRADEASSIASRALGRKR